MEDFEWNVINEGYLLESMVGHKPVGINRYFQMACIWDKFTDSVQKEITSEKVWSHLKTMYNLEALDENESIPFPNNEKDFTLPESEFGTLLSKKEEDRKSTQKGRETPKSVKEIRKEDKTPNRSTKEIQRRDSKDSKDKTPVNSKKEMRKDLEKSKTKNKNSNSAAKDEVKSKKDDTPKPAKRPTRGSLKPDDSSSSGKSSPVTVTPPVTKRRRI